ncbi:MAG: flagellar export chaperone FliS [Burkholderiales bacterium]
MFAPAAVYSANAFAGTYRQIGVETGVPNASPHQLVTMLFDGFNDAVAQARVAMQQGKIEPKGKAIVRAVRIVEEGLLANLDVDAGGKIADDLMALYSYVTRRLTHANMHNDTAALDECVRLMEPLRSAWVAIGPGAAAATKAQ